MKLLFFLLGISITGISIAQEDSTRVTEDTSDIYVINSTNRLMKVGDDYSIEFRDLKSLDEVHYIRLDTEADVKTFFADCYKVLDQNTTVSKELYSINRNVLSKFVIRIEHDDEAYFMLAYGTLEKMEKAFNRYLRSSLSE